MRGTTVVACLAVVLLARSGDLIGTALGEDPCSLECLTSDPAPRCQVVAEALFLGRDNRSHARAVVVDSNTDETVLSTRDLGFGEAAGPRLTLSWQANPDATWEIVYFGMHQWDAGARATGDNDLSLAGDIGQLFPSDYNMADQVRVDYSAYIHNAEVNYLERLGGMSVLAGFRYFSLSEHMDIHAFDSDSGDSHYRTSASNDLYGGQVGAAVKRRQGRFGWEAIAKAGLFGNAAEQTNLLRDLDNEFLLRDSRNRGGKLAFVGEIGLSATWQLTRAWSVRGGYNLLWIEGVAMAPDQLDFTDTSTSGTAIVDGGVFLHGANVGLEARW